MPRGPKKHLKRLNAPSHWMLDKLGGVFVSSRHTSDVNNVQIVTRWPCQSSTLGNLDVLPCVSDMYMVSVKLKSPDRLCAGPQAITRSPQAEGVLASHSPAQEQAEVSAHIAISQSAVSLQPACFVTVFKAAILRLQVCLDR